jgi:hypothetical protein
MSDPASQPSFSPSRKWRIGFQVFFVTLLIFAVVVMVNYLSREYFFRFHVSSRTKLELAPRTVGLLKSLTNRIQVIVYYDKKDPLYSTVVDLLNEYHAKNSRISVLAIDYKRDVAAAEKIKAEHKLGSVTDKNLVIFECEGREKIIPADALADYTVEQVREDKETPYHRRLVAFKGEMMFTSCLLAVTNPKSLKAYFLTNHEEHRIDSTEEDGYSKFAAVLQQNYITNATLSLVGTNPIPLDCNLLVIAGPRNRIPEPELEKIDQYLTQGGRLLVLFNFNSLNNETGLEPILAKWGVTVGNNAVSDPEHSPSTTRLGEELVVSAFGKHPLVAPLLGGGLDLIQPRTISGLKARTEAADAPQVLEIAFSGQNSFLLGDPLRRPYQYLPLMAAVEKGAIKGVITERGTTRIVVGGDSFFLDNALLDSYSNRDFAGYLANWLLDRPQLLEGLSPRNVQDYKVVTTDAQMQSAQLILLGGMPGSVLVLGGLVWLRRRR